MNDKDNSNLVSKVVDNIRNKNAEYQEGLAVLLDDYRTKAGHTFAVKSTMGKCESYIASVSLKWVYDNVKYAADLPLFKQEITAAKNIELNEDSKDIILQRTPDWTRQVPLTLYLTTQENHKFPSLLLVGYENWNYEPEDNDHWDEVDRALDVSIPITQMNSDGYFLDLQTKETKYFALDGQHRFMAIQGLIRLLEEKRLAYKDKNGNEKRKYLTYDEVVEKIQENYNCDEIKAINVLDNLKNELIGIEILPAVQMGETIQESVDRVRKIFVDVNDNTKRLTSGELAQLDSINPFKIIARRVMVKHPLLNGIQTNVKSKQLAESSHEYTTLQSIVEVARLYLSQNEKFSHWKKIKKETSVKPPDSELDEGFKLLYEYYDELYDNLQSHRKYGERSSIEEKQTIRQESDWDHILFRSIAQEALAEAVGYLINKDKSVLTISSIMNVLGKHERSKADHDFKLRKEGSIWNGIFWNTPEKKMRVTKKYNQLGAKMFIYLFNGIDDEKIRTELREEYRNAKQDLEIELPDKWA